MKELEQLKKENELYTQYVQLSIDGNQREAKRVKKELMKLKKSIID
jgi:hypothetical protein